MPNYSGIWTEQAVMQAVGAGNWPGNPGAPTIGTATGGNASASVTFTAPANNGGSAITSYTVTSSPGSLTGTGASSPITVSGLTNGTAYTFTVTATNGTGTGPASAASNSVTPVPPNVIEDVFSTYLYTGQGSTNSYINGIDLASNGGLVWIKARSGTYGTAYHSLFDTARGTGKILSSNSTAAQSGNTGDLLSAFNSNGFTVNTTYLGGFNESTNASATNYASWTFRKKSKFFDIVTYTGNGVAGREIPHNLGSTPGCVIIKSTSGETNWSTWHNGLAVDQVSFLNTTDQSFAEGDFYATAPTSTVFTVAGFGRVNGSGSTYVAYLFASNSGGFGASGNDNVISCGSFTADGNNTITLGYEPQWVLTKRTNTSGNNWEIYDTMRGMSLTSSKVLNANTSGAEGVSGTVYPTATGFYISNYGSGTIIYIAIRRGPMATPTVGTSVFNALSRTGTAATATVPTTILPDLVMSQARGGTYNVFYDRLRGAQATLSPSLGTDAESVVANGLSAFNNTSYIVGTDASQNRINWNTYTYANWLFSSAPGFFDEVCWTGNNGSNQRVSHNLGVVPELIIYKGRNKVNYWRVYFGSINTYIQLDAGIAAVSGSNLWGSSAPTTTDFGINCGSMDLDNFNAVAYLFATCAGVSKVGSYTGTGATQTVNCGFAAGARWVMIKRTDSTGDWYVWDTVRGMVSGTDPSLLLNSTAAEVNANSVYTTAVGFQIVSTAAGINASGGSYIFLAIA